MKVGVEKKAEDGTKTLELVPLSRPITILDLMRHTSGITYGFYGDSLVRKAYAAADLYAGDFDLGRIRRADRQAAAAQPAGRALAIRPFHRHPGRVMEIVSGKSLLEIEREKLLDPLGMKDTGFFVTRTGEAEVARPAVPNDSNFRVGREYRVEVPPEVGIRQRRHGYDHVGFFALCADAAQRRNVRGQDLSQPEDVRTGGIGSHCKGSGVERDYFYFPGDGFGMGLGLAVRTDPGNAKPPPPESLGELKWDGASRLLYGD